MGGDGGKRKREEEALRRQAEIAHKEAKEVDPLEQRQRDYITALDKWRMGEGGPIDVRKMPGGGVGISLFNEAKASRDAGRIGRGYGTLGGEGNSNFATALDKEMQLERDLAASGQLEGYVGDTLSDLDARMMGLSQASSNRRMSLADMAMQRYLGEVNRPQQPSFLKQLAIGGLSAASGLITKI